MTGFGTAASRGYPDLGLLSSGDVLAHVRFVLESLREAAASASPSESPRQLPLPCLVDGDTGYGAVRRTVLNFAAAGAAGVLIEDQASTGKGGVLAKRCGHVEGKDVVPFEEALERVRAAVQARDEHAYLITGQRDNRDHGGDHYGPLILARTDARGSMSYASPGEGLAEGIRRCQAFREAGADITFLESPRNADEMKEYCDKVEGPKLANLIEKGGKTPTEALTLDDLGEMGFTLAATPLSLLSAATKAMNKVLDAQANRAFRTGDYEEDLLLEFEELKRAVGFDSYLS